MALFDSYVMVDWSAESRPKRGKDSIWLAHLRRVGGAWAPAAPKAIGARLISPRHAKDARKVIARLRRSRAGPDITMEIPQPIHTLDGRVPVARACVP